MAIALTPSLTYSELNYVRFRTLGFEPSCEKKATLGLTVLSQIAIFIITICNLSGVLPATLGYGLNGGLSALTLCSLLALGNLKERKWEVLLSSAIAFISTGFCIALSITPTLSITPYVLLSIRIAGFAFWIKHSHDRFSLTKTLTDLASLSFNNIQKSTFRLIILQKTRVPPHTLSPTSYNKILSFINANSFQEKINHLCSLVQDRSALTLLGRILNSNILNILISLAKMPIKEEHKPTMCSQVRALAVEETSCHLVFNFLNSTNIMEKISALVELKENNRIDYMKIIRRYLLPLFSKILCLPTLNQPTSAENASIIQHEIREVSNMVTSCSNIQNDNELEQNFYPCCNKLLRLFDLLKNSASVLSPALRPSDTSICPPPPLLLLPAHL